MKNSFCWALAKHPLGPAPGRRTRGLPAAVLAALAASHSAAKRRAKSSNSRTVRLVLARISRSDRLAWSREIMPLCLPRNRAYYQSPLMFILWFHVLIDPQGPTVMDDDTNLPDLPKTQGQARRSPGRNCRNKKNSDQLLRHFKVACSNRLAATHRAVVLAPRSRRFGSRIARTGRSETCCSPRQLSEPAE